MSKESIIQIQCVHGGFIVTNHIDEETIREVFMSPGKLLKALREMIDEQSLLPKKDEGDSVIDNAAKQKPAKDYD